MCDCELCVRGNEFFQRLKRIPKAERAYFESIYELLAAAEMDRDVNAAIIDGSWPTADECIAAARDRDPRYTITPAGAAMLERSKG